MSIPMTTVQIPEDLYRRLERLATLTHHSLEEVLAKTLDSSMPPLPESWPEEMRADLLALESLNDDALWQVARRVQDRQQAEEHQRLLENNSAGTLTPAERTRLEQLRQEADRLMVRKAYAYAILKWRGHRLPTLAELEAQA